MFGRYLALAVAFCGDTTAEQSAVLLCGPRRANRVWRSTWKEFLRSTLRLSGRRLVAQSLLLRLAMMACVVMLAVLAVFVAGRKRAL